MQDKKLTNAKIVIDALRNHYGEKVGEFAARLGVSATTVSTWASRDSLDKNLIFRKCEGVRYEFLETGRGEMFTSSGVIQEPANDAYASDQKELLSCWEKMGEVERMALLICARAMAGQSKK